MALVILTACTSKEPRPTTAPGAPPAPAAQGTVSPMSSSTVMPAQESASAAAHGLLAVDNLCVTSGTATAEPGSTFLIASPTFRAVSRFAWGDDARLAFTYRGETDETRALGSGAVRRQIGLKLRAQDPCNLVYVMWRFSPTNDIVVSLKENPGQSTSHECGNRGYTNLTPAARTAPPAIDVRSAHVLEATIGGNRLDVRIDSVVVWSGDLPAAALALRGPAGVRSDNVRASCGFSTSQRGADIPCPTGASPD